MADYDYDIGIIGGGAAGLTVASGAAQLGAKTLLVEKEAALGGDCLHYGCVPSKTLIKTAHVYHLMKSSPQFGLPAIAPPAVDFREVSKRIRSVIGVIQQHDSVERFCKLGAQVEFGNLEFTDEHAISLNGKAISARTWAVQPMWQGLGSKRSIFPSITTRGLRWMHISGPVTSISMRPEMSSAAISSLM